MAKQLCTVALLALVLHTAACKSKPVPAPPPPPPPPAKQNLIALLPDPEGKPGRMVVINSAGSQELNQDYQAVRVERADVAPSAPFVLSPDEVKQLFGSALGVMPAPEVQFVLYFAEGKDELTRESEAQMPAIVRAVQERRSTAISVTGHTDTTGNSKANYQLGLKRSERVAAILKANGVAGDAIFVTSHGDADLLVKTPRGVAEQRNRRVEVIVR